MTVPILIVMTILRFSIQRMLQGILLAGIFCANAQNSNAKDSIQMEEVIRWHDRAMAHMPETVKLINQLTSKSKTIEYDSLYVDAISRLKKANSGMMAWMERFGNRFTAEEMYKGKSLSEEKKKWLSEEEIGIKQLNEDIDQSAKLARSLLTAD